MKKTIRAERMKDSEELVKIFTPYYKPRIYSREALMEQCICKSVVRMCIEYIAENSKVAPLGKVDGKLINSIGFFNLDSMENVAVLIVNCITQSRKKLPIQILYEDYIFTTYFPGSEVPHWFSSKNIGSSISFTVTLSPHCYFRGMNLCLVYTLPANIDSLPFPLLVEISMKGSGTREVHRPRCYGIPEPGGDMVWLSYWVERNLFKEGDEVQVRFEINGDGQIKECGVHLLYVDEVGALEMLGYFGTLRRSLKPYVFQVLPGFPTPDKENIYTQVHQYSDATISTSGTAPEGGVLSMEESVRLNEMVELVTQGQKLSPEDKESLTRVTDALEETPSDPRELEGFNCDPVEVPPTSSLHFSILHVLDLSYTEINSLPQSITRLIALQKLFLRSCELLMELPPEIGELTNLEVLDLEGTEILCLPKEIAKLVNLTCLKVSFYGYANQTLIPNAVLSNLSRLIELIIDVTPYGEWWDVEVEAILDDLCSLKELRTLKLYLPTAELLEELTLIFPSLANFRFTVGRHEEHFISRLPQNVEEEFNNREKLEKGLKFINGNHIPIEITKVLKHANAFVLQRHWNAESLSDFGHENMNEAKFCLVTECNEFQTIVDCEQFYQGKDGLGESEDFKDFDEVIVLGSLEKLIIHYMKNMVSIWKGPLWKGSLSNLKSLALHTCPNLIALFTIDMLRNLINLEELIVEDCPKIDCLVSLKSSGTDSGLFLPNLKKISLLELPELVSISSGLCIAPKLERMVIFYCPKLKKLSTMDVSSTNIKVIKGEKEWWDALKWYESDLCTKHEDYLARLFIPLRMDEDLMAQLTKD